MPIIRKYKVKRRKGAAAPPLCKKRLNCRVVPRLPGQKSDEVIVACNTAAELKEYGARLRRRERCKAKKAAEKAAEARKASAKPRKKKAASTASSARDEAPKAARKPRKKKGASTASTARAEAPKAERKAASTPRAQKTASTARASKPRAKKSSAKKAQAQSRRQQSSRSPFQLGAGDGGSRLPANLRAALDRFGLDWPTTQKKVGARFSELASRKHPDKGGSNQQMKLLIQDRKLILSAIASSSG